MEVLSLFNEKFEPKLRDIFKFRLILIGIGRRGHVELVFHALLDVESFFAHYNLTQQESNRINLELSFYKYNQQVVKSFLLHNNMWKSIGSIPSPTAKGRDEVTYEPFAQASRLRLNQSQLSGESSPQFMQQYFSKKRSPDAMSQRSHSQKSMEILSIHSPITSLRNVVSPQAKSKPPSISSKLKDQNSFIETYKQIANGSISNEKDSHPSKNQQIYSELKKIKEEQARLKKSIQNELSTLKNQMKETETQILLRLNQASQEAESRKKQGLNPEVLSKIRQQSQRFNERIRDIENRKQQVKQKYRMKNKS